MKLDAKAFGLACGILWALGVLALGLMAPFCPWSAHFVNVLAPFYVGYAGGPVGSVIGALWGFADAGIGGLVFAWLYNKLAKTS